MFSKLLGSGIWSNNLTSLTGPTEDFIETLNKAVALQEQKQGADGKTSEQ
jgi:hypothetical protein